MFQPLRDVRCIYPSRLRSEWNHDHRGKSVISALPQARRPGGVAKLQPFPAASRLVRVLLPHVCAPPRFRLRSRLALRPLSRSLRPGNDGGRSQINSSGVSIQTAPQTPVNGTNVRLSKQHFPKASAGFRLYRRHIHRLGGVSGFSRRYRYFVSRTWSRFGF